ncbi:MAG TPA: RDD family protein [Actinomycetota bacterium]
MTYIGPGRRFFALLIDGLIIGLAWVPFAEVESGDGAYSIGWRGLDFVIPMLITVAYFIVLEGAFGATVGKFMLGIRVRSLDGSRIGFGAAAIRNIARIVDAFPYFLPYLVGGIAVTRSDTKQRFGDRWGKTVVILMGTDAAAPTSAAPPPQHPETFGLPSPPPGTPPAGGALPPPPE